MLKIVRIIYFKFIVYYILKGTITLYTDKGNPFIKYRDGDTVGDSDTLLNVYHFVFNFLETQRL
jgi:hypothetical protein